MKHKGQARGRFNAVLLWAFIFAGGVFTHAAVFSGDHRGKDFWICFPAGMFDPYVFITAEGSADVTIDIPGLGWSDSFSLAAGEGAKRAIPPEAEFDILTDDGVEFKGVHIQSTADIAVYGYHSFTYAEGGFLALPVAGLGFEHIAACYTDWADNTPSGHFLVLAAENDTSVTVIPSDDYGARASGAAYTIGLDQGQIYRLGGMQSGTTYDLTGSRICSDKPVAVYIGAPGGFIPGNYCCSDVIVDQAPPLADLGTDYLAVPYINRDYGDFVRIVAAYDGTEVKIDGATAAVIGQGEFHDLSIFIPVHITANLPVLVTQFMKAETMDYMFGDPELMVVTPTANFLTGYLTMTDDSSTWFNYSNIVVPTEAAGDLYVDGVALDPGVFSPVGSSGFSFVQLPITTGTHAFSCSTPFGAYIYGKRWFSSYAFSAGMALRPKTACADLRMDISPPYAEQVVGGQICFDLRVSDSVGLPGAGETIGISCSGVNSWSYVLLSDESGAARHCYASGRSGRDEIIAVTCGCGTGASDRAEVRWSEPLGPYRGPLRIFPNPFDPRTAVRGTLKFEGLPLGGRVRIYTIRGLKVWEGTVEKPYILEWDGCNLGRDPVAPGTYIWVAESGESKEQGTLIVK